MKLFISLSTRTPRSATPGGRTPGLTTPEEREAERKRLKLSDELDDLKFDDEIEDLEDKLDKEHKKRMSKEVVSDFTFGTKDKAKVKPKKPAGEDADDAEPSADEEPADDEFESDGDDSEE